MRLKFGFENSRDEANVAGHFNIRLYHPKLQPHNVETFTVEKSWVKEFRVKNSGDEKIGFKKFRVEKFCNMGGALLLAREPLTSNEIPTRILGN